jgi:ribosomal-protein-alanine N-acetyltransferase
MDVFTIREANESDVKILADIDERCFRAPWSEKSFFEEITTNEIAKYVVAEINGKVVGYAGIWIILDEGHITNVAVHPDYRRKGIAKAVVSEAMAKSKEVGANLFTLEVRASNKDAISLYEQFDFKKVGVRKEYYEDNGEDAVIMWKIN